MSAPNPGNSSAPSPAANNARRTVFVMGDHPVVNAGLASLINSAPDLTLCGVGRSTPTLLEQLKALSPALVILDLTPTVQGFLELLRDMKRQLPASRILILCDKADQFEASRAATLSAGGIIMKHQDTEALLHAIRYALASGPHRTSKAQFSHPQPRSNTLLQPDRLDALTKRERDVLRLTGLSKTPDEIAQELGLSTKTIATHRSKIKEKLGLASLTELIRLAVQLRRVGSTSPIDTVPAARVRPSP